MSWAMLAASAAALISSRVAFLSSSRHSEGDVFADGVAEEECLLGNEADMAAQGVERELADGVAVDKNGPGRGVVNARDQADERGLSRAGGAHDGEAGAGGNAQVDVLKNRCAVVREVEIAEFDFTKKIG